MPRLLIYEECLAAGTQGPLGKAAMRFLPEGLAMTQAIAEDFAKLPGWQVRVLRSFKFKSQTPEKVDWQWVECRTGFESILEHESRAADTTLVIAPECEGILQRRAQAIIDAGGKLLGPSAEFIGLTSNKTALLEHLSAIGFIAPRGMRGSLTSLVEGRLKFPAILKPNDGAGAGETWRFNEYPELQNFIISRVFLGPFESAENAERRAFWRCEEFIPGQPASVALLCGPAGPVALRPATQQIVFAEDGRASYHGGAINLSPAEELRVQKLGLTVARALPPTNGYFGVDLILGEATDGGQDTVIEVNPRLTTSYLGLRAATDDSLAEAMWRIAHGETVNINWLPNTVEFSKQGQVTIRDR